MAHPEHFKVLPWLHYDTGHLIASDLLLFACKVSE